MKKIMLKQHFFNKVQPRTKIRKKIKIFKN